MASIFAKRGGEVFKPLRIIGESPVPPKSRRRGSLRKHLAIACERVPYWRARESLSGLAAASGLKSNGGLWASGEASKSDPAAFGREAHGPAAASLEAQGLGRDPVSSKKPLFSEREPRSSEREG
jgi:hypothetical protein